MAFMVIIILFVCVNYTYSQLSPTKRKELVIAYMNGYYRALQLDIKELKELQKNKNKLKKKVKAAGREYANLIDIMNSSRPNKGHEGIDREYKDGESKDSEVLRGGNQRY